MKLGQIVSFVAKVIFQDMVVVKNVFHHVKLVKVKNNVILVLMDLSLFLHLRNASYVNIISTKIQLQINVENVILLVNLVRVQVWIVLVA